MTSSVTSTGPAKSRPAMNDAMTDREQGAIGQDTLRSSRGDRRAAARRCCRRDGAAFSTDLLPDASVTVRRGAELVLVEQAPAKQVRIGRRDDIEQRELDAGGACVQDQDGVGHQVPACLCGRARSSSRISRHVLAMLAHIARMLDQGVAKLLLHMALRRRQPGHAIDRPRSPDESDRARSAPPCRTASSSCPLR